MHWDQFVPHPFFRPAGPCICQYPYFWCKLLQMRKYLTMLLLVLFTVPAAQAAFVPPATPVPAVSRQQPAAVSLRGPVRPAGRFERLKLKLLQRILRRPVATGEMTEKQRRKARWSLILGVASFLMLFLPVVVLLSLPAGVAAIVLGVQSLKGNSNTQAIIGIIAGSLAILLLFAVLVYLLTAI